MRSDGGGGGGGRGFWRVLGGIFEGWHFWIAEWCTMKLIDDGRFENDLFIFIIKMASSGLAFFSSSSSTFITSALYMYIQPLNMNYPI